MPRCRCVLQSQRRWAAWFACLPGMAGMQPGCRRLPINTWCAVSWVQHMQLLDVLPLAWRMQLNNMLCACGGLAQGGHPPGLCMPDSFGTIPFELQLLPRSRARWAGARRASGTRRTRCSWT